MSTPNRRLARAATLLVLALGIIAFGLLAIRGDRPAEASRLQQAASDAASPDGVAEVAQVSATTFNYQGILRDVQGDLINGEREITLKIYDSVMGGTELHSETFAAVQVRDGLFNVVLGDATPIEGTVFSAAPRYVGVTVAPDPEMVPRQRLHPVPWAQQASSAQVAGFATTALNANQATNALSANSASTLIDGATVKNLTVDGGLSLPAYRFLRLETAPERQTYPYFSMGSNGSFQIDADGVAGGRFIVDADGNVGIGKAVPELKLDVEGKIRAAQGFNGKCIQEGEIWRGTCNQDVAETFASTVRTEPGDVVVLHSEASDEPTVELSQGAYADQLMGVVSTNPGLVFDSGQTYLAGNNADLISDDETVVAMIGRVPVKISTENGEIAVGDPLASASRAGAAMKATRAGQILGYALQSSDEAQDGKILAWLQLGYYVPPETLARINGVADAGLETDAETAGQVEARDLATELEQLRTLNAALLERIEALEVGR